MNPLLEQSSHPYEAISYDLIKPEHFLPALDAAIKNSQEKFNAIKACDATFENILIASEEATSRLDQITEIFYALYSAECSEDISAISQEFSEKITKFSNDITLDAEIFAKVKDIYENTDKSKLSVEENTLLESSFKDFTRNGALLNESDKNILREYDEKLASLSLSFSENVRKGTNDYVLFVTDERRLDGLPEDSLSEAKRLASEKGKEGQFAFTLDYPCYLPFMKYVKDAELRKEIYIAKSTVGVAGELSNQSILKETLSLRESRAKLLGFENHAEFVLEKRMAQNPKKVVTFLNEILEKAIPAANNDFKKLQTLQKELTGSDIVNKFDSTLLSETLKKRELDIDDEILRPYFKLENVIAGVFEIAKKLYGIKFTELTNIPKYHEDVMTYKVESLEGEFIGLFYADFFPRATKRPGAWMTDLRKQGLQFGEVKRPFVSIVCNFTKPTGNKPSLLTLDETLTLFHEFGHALHGLLAKSTYRSLSGTSVYWDFVELPSQIMENWVLEKEALDLFAVHYETGEKMPAEYIEKIKKSQQFLEGLGTLRQLSFSFLDMAWHTENASEIKDVLSFEKEAMKKYELYPEVDGTSMSCSFGHIFSGGYAAGYYSYKWAEVLDADAFEFFKEKGIFNTDVAKAFKENILEKGGTEHPMDLYKKFRGQEPTSDALLKRAGLI